jgi:hypothetical protein
MRASAMEFRQRAIDCLRLAKEATDVYAKAALTELATEFRQKAEAIDRRDRNVKASLGHSRKWSRQPRGNARADRARPTLSRSDRGK